MPEISALKNLPEVSFIDRATVEDIRGEMVADYEAFMEKATGKPMALDRASPHRMELYSAAAQIYHAMQYIDRAGKRNLLRYSYADFLDHLAAFKGLARDPAASAATTLRFTLSAARAAATGIPAGTRATAPDWSLYFATTEYMEIPAGAMTVDVPASCIAPGTAGNGLTEGKLSVLVDPIPYMASVTNITVTAGGAEVESDEHLAERIYLFPGSYSTAGPEDSYRYHAKKFNVNVGDMGVFSDQEAGTVDICFLMTDGTIPPPEMLTGMQNYFQDRNVRPMTDLVRVAAPSEVEYAIELTYYINRSDSGRAVTIQEKVDAAVASYAAWQRAIGRDINPSKLLELVMAAGAKRVEIAAPVRQIVDTKSVAALTGQTVHYGGWKMIDLRGSRFTDIMPRNLASQLETQAFAYALGRQIEKLCAYADGIQIYAAVAAMPEKILDVLAVELRTPAYDQQFPIEVKRALVEGTLSFYAHLGTPAACDRIIETIFGSGRIEEWFDYGGNPHHFRAYVGDGKVAAADIEKFRQVIGRVKRLSSWLDEIIITLPALYGPIPITGRLAPRISRAAPPMHREVLPAGRIPAAPALGTRRSTVTLAMAVIE